MEMSRQSVLKELLDGDKTSRAATVESKPDRLILSNNGYRDQVRGVSKTSKGSATPNDDPHPYSHLSQLGIPPFPYGCYPPPPFYSMQNGAYTAGGNPGAQALPVNWNGFQHPSSYSVDGLGDDIIYPKIDDWLKDLDNHKVRGQDGFNFSQYGPCFKTQKFIWIDQLADSQRVSVDKLAEWLDIEVGVAEIILKYAAVDVKRLKREGQEKSG
ncbi:hypothetical protein FRC03_003220 [Tulasnella sp. 419]|nr:hypothetical protein FRC03_003220 [Tulasnella sp. 419]